MRRDPLVLPLDFPPIDEPPRSNPWQVVLYRQRAIVVWNRSSLQIQVKQLSAKETQILAQSRFANCPMCGQAVDASKFSFEAAAYFRVLQEAMKAYVNRDRDEPRRPRRSHTYWTRVTPPMLAEDEPQPRARAESEVSNSTPSSQDNQFKPSRTSVDDPDLAALRNIPIDLLVDEYYEKFFVEERRLGSGSYGQVFLCYHKLDDLVLGQYAIKKIPVGDSKEWLNRMLREVKIREHLHHINIVSYKHSWLEMSRANEFCPRVPWLFVLMEYCDGGDLEGLMKQVEIHRRPPRLSELEIWCLFVDIVDGLQHLHHAGILHRDLKPQNILLRLDHEHGKGLPHVTRALLADFGTAEVLLEGHAVRMGSGYTGTVEYTAPELLETEAETGMMEYDFNSDMWSLGLILHYLTYGHIPFGTGESSSMADPAITRTKLAAFVQRLISQPLTPNDLPLLGDETEQRPVPVDDKRSIELRQCIIALLSLNPKARPSCDDLSNAALVRGLRERSGMCIEARKSLTRLLTS